MNNIYFTKSAFKISLDCPTKLYYCCDSRYANQDDHNEFMHSLADGGFQVGELAKLYYHIGEDHCIQSKDYDKSLELTEALLREENVNIAEAAFRFGKYFVRADIIEKVGNQINLIEVKAKSFDSSSGTTITRARSKSDILPYVQDVAFQKYVISSALKEKFPQQEYSVHAFLMMMDKSIPAPMDGMNQFFKINGPDCSEHISVHEGAGELLNCTKILTAFDVNGYCDEIISEQTFIPFIERMADAYCNHVKVDTPLSHKCYNCPFTSPDNKYLDGFKECWKRMAGFKDDDFSKPSLRQFNMNGFFNTADKLIEQRHYFMDDITAEDINQGSGINTERRGILYGLETKNQSVLSKYGQSIIDGEYFLDKEILKKRMSAYKFPLHFIDFETAATALPFYKGMRPYEDIAFQYSHHTVFLTDGSYKIEHTNQYLNTEKGYFPNFDFIRSLRDSLSKDEGTIFRYANHENKILRSIRAQLINSQVPDKEELIVFIDSITHSSKNESAKHKGARDMVDLEALVKECFLYPKFMNGRTSIKVVLPAVLNASKFLQHKYSKPIYGTSIKSCNYSYPGMAVQWIKKKYEGNEIENPYHELELIERDILLNAGFSEMMYDKVKDEIGQTVADGGAALTAYSKLQYSDIVATEVLRNALFRYCELDTMAMVFIWEFFYNEIRKIS